MSVGIGTFTDLGQEDREERDRNGKARFLGLVALVLLGISALFLIASQTYGYLAAIGICGLIFAMAAALGGVVGFLFSVPRILAKDPLAPVSELEDQQPGDDARGRRRLSLLRSNSNLERISEWLTTMLVGVGLTQIGTLDDRLYSFSEYLKLNTAHLGPSGQSIPIVGPFILLFGLVAGFIFFYLYTRIYLSALFQYVERVLGDHLNDPIEEGADEVTRAAEELSPDSENPSVKMVSGGAAPSVNQTLDIIRSLLYVEDGYQRAIDLGNRISGSSARSNPEYWLLMACAFGQKHHALLERPDLAGEPADKTQQALIDIKNSVLTCVRNAVALDGRYKQRLKNLSRPSAYDNDLRDFHDYQPFLDLVG
jgi:hypothetical protein